MHYSKHQQYSGPFNSIDSGHHRGMKFCPLYLPRGLICTKRAHSGLVNFIVRGDLYEGYHCTCTKQMHPPIKKNLPHKHCLHESSNPGSTHFRSRTEFDPIHQWMWVESTRVTIQVGGVHTGGESGLNPG